MVVAHRNKKCFRKSDKMTVSEYIFDFFSKKGIDTTFMVSGSSAMWLVDALQREKRYNVICNHHEQACAMSAEAYARVSGEMAICLVTVGPGATNAITGVAGAYVDSTPMIVLSGQSSTGMINIAKETGVRQQGTQSLLLEDMVKPITKYFATVMDAGSIAYHVEKAFYSATHERPGPVWLDIPVDIQNKQVPSNMEGYNPYDVKKDTNVISLEEVCEWLTNSRRPLILAGQGVNIANARSNLISLIEKLQIPIVTTRMGIDLIETEHPLYVGRPGAYGDRASHYAIQNSDFLLCIGTRMAVSTVGYDGKNIAWKAKKVWVDIDPLEVSRNYVPMDAKFSMDAKEFLLALSEAMNNKSLKTKTWISQCSLWKEKYDVILPEYSKEEPLNSYYVVDKISKKAKEGAVIVVDTGTSCNVVSQAWNLKKGQRYIISGGISCMGYWAGAIGACLAIKDTQKQILALTGDGSFQMNVQELATIKYNRLPVKLFVFENGGYLLIRLNQHNYMNDRFLGVGPDSGVGMPNIIKVAEAYGIKSVDISTLEELDGKLDEVFKCNEPVVCVIHTNSFQEMSPRMASRVMSDGSLKASAYEDLCPFLPDDEHKNNMISERMINE
jgi:acetolactate synthase-1/2/3 large subunit